MIRPEDDLFHPRNDDPYWNESCWTGFMVPERQLSGFVYFYHRPNMGLSAGGVALWDPTGEHLHTCVYHEWNEHQHLPDGAEMFHFQLDNSLMVETVELQKRYRMAYKNDGCELDLVWRSLMEPNEMTQVKPQEVNPSIEGWGTGHYEQAGAVAGMVTIDGERLEVECFSLRDHSWGPRPHQNWPRGGYSWAVASESTAFNTTAISTLPGDTDPMVGTTERVVSGFYLADGSVGDLVAGERRVERGSDGRPLRVVLDAEDHLGRSLHGEAQCENWLQWSGYSTMYCWWTLCSWTLNGEAAWGEEQDFFTKRQSRRLHQSLRVSL